MNERTPFHVGERITLTDGTEVTVLALSPTGRHALVTGGAVLHPDEVDAS